MPDLPGWRWWNIRRRSVRNNSFGSVGRRSADPAESEYRKQNFFFREWRREAAPL